MTVMAKSFDAGIKFEYWHAHDENYVQSHFYSLKQEAFGSKSISIEQWNKINLKANFHYDTKKARNTRFNNKFDGNHHGIPKNATISKKHLISIILYCDYSALCTKMSATFRKMTASETEESVANRNSKFFHFSKLLTEAVQDFGIDGTKEKGPFYCGINCVLHFSSFAMIFYGPCSTSKQIEIAMNFSKSDGSIISLQNEGFGSFQKFLDVSWISRFPEEDERVWIQGLNMMNLRMASIRIMRGSLNYKDWMHALFMFDAMVSGVHLPTKIKKKDIRALKALINGTHKGIHQYIINCFWLYCQKKTKIVIRTQNQETLEDLVMTQVPIEGTKYNEETKEWQIVNNVDQKNTTSIVPKSILFDLFPNLERMTIMNIKDGKKFRRFPLSSFLPFIECGKSPFVYEIGAKFDKSIGEDVPTLLALDYLDNHEKYELKCEYEKVTIVKK